MEVSYKDETVPQECQESSPAMPAVNSSIQADDEDMIIEVISPSSQQGSALIDDDYADTTSVCKPQDDVEIKEVDPKSDVEEPITVDDDKNNSVTEDEVITQYKSTETELVEIQSIDSNLKDDNLEQDKFIKDKPEQVVLDKHHQVKSKQAKLAQVKAAEIKSIDDKPIDSKPTDETSTELIPLDITLKDEKEGRRKRKSVMVQQQQQQQITITPVNSAPPIEENGSMVKRRRIEPKHDDFCWRCHKEAVEIQCKACPRSWHRRCMGGAPPLSPKIQWICSECATILQAEHFATRSKSMAELSIDQLCMLLKHVVERMRDQTGSEPFWKPVNMSLVTNYTDYIIKPMDLSLLENNIKLKMYGSTEAFIADAKWIQHNCIVFNTCGGVYADTSKLTNTAKQMLKMARQEVSEIEACPDCYAHGRNLPQPHPLWFIEPCRRPHPIVWAKLKGFPFWPAKAMPRLNTQGLVDVRFFGQHDRAWVSPKDIFLFSEEPPAPLPRKKKTEMEECVQEVKRYCEKLEQVFGKYTLPQPKIQYDPHDPMQIKLLLPFYDPTNSSQNIPTKSEASKEKKTIVKKKPLVPKKSVDIPTKPTSVVDSKPDDSKPSVINNDVASTKVENQKVLRKKKTVVTPRLKGKEESNNSLNKSGTNKILSPGIARIVVPATKIAMKNILKAKRVKIANSKTSMPIQPVKSGSTSNSNSNKNSMAKIKPKSKMVEQVNMEKKIINNANHANSCDKAKVTNTVDIKINNSKDISSKKRVTAVLNSASKVISKDQRPKAVYVVVNTSSVDTVRRSMINSETNRNQENIATIKQEPKEEQQPTWKRESKARKSFRNKPPSFPQKINSISRISNNSSDAMVYIPPRPNNINNNHGSSNSSNNSQSSSTYELPPPEAGPATARLHRGSKELAVRMAQILEETIKDVAESNEDSSNLASNPGATIHVLKLKVERMKWQHQQEIQELKHNHECVLRELRASTEVERYRAIQEVRREADIEKFRCIEETKRKQWCAMCGREAMFYCCWNTAYCDYPCQQKHWSTHMNSCAQKSSPRVADAIVTSSTVKNHQQQGMPKLVINTNRSMPNQWRS